MRDVLCQKLVDSLAARPPPLTRRDIRLPAVRNKALAVIGMRRSGKSTFLWQCLDLWDRYEFIHFIGAAFTGSGR